MASRMSGVPPSPGAPPSEVVCGGPFRPSPQCYGAVQPSGLKEFRVAVELLEIEMSGWAVVA